ncbi:MAG: YdcH family protein [Dongiaceae bacterium]
MLKAKHAQLEEAVRVESARPMPDFFVITELKRKRLRLKEEIADAEAGMAVKAAS